MSKKMLLFLLLLVWVRFTNAQDKQFLDSLKSQLSTVVGEERVKVLRDLCYYGSYLDTKEAIVWGEEAAELAISIGDSVGLCGAYNDLFAAYSNGGKMESALDFAERALVIARKIGNKKSVASSLQNAGIAYTKKGNYSKALAYMFEALELRESIEGTNLGSIFGEISGVYLENKDFDKSLEYQLLALKEEEQFGSAVGLSRVYNNLAIVYQYKGLLEKAEEYIYKAVELSKERNDEFQLAANYHNLGELYQLQNKSDLAIKWFNTSLELKEKLNADKYIPHTLMKLAQVYAQVDDVRNAEKHARMALDVASINGDNNIKLQIYKVLSDLFRGNANYEESLEYLRLYIELKDSIYTESKEAIIADLDSRYQTSKKEAANRILMAESQKQAAEIKQQSQWMIAIAFGAGLILLFFGILYNVYRQKLNANKQLEQQKLELVQLNSTKDRFFGIIAHDLRNPVVSFQGLSKLIRAYVRKGQIDRIESLSEKINQSVSNLNRLLDNLLSWASSQTGTLPYHPEPLNVKQVLEENFSLFGEMAFSKQINLVNLIKEDVFVFADKNGVSTIFRNLINNALKFTPEGGEISISATVDHGQVKLTVADNGVGMDQNMIQSLFHLSNNESTEGTYGERGSGLGLVLCKEFIELNKGKIWVQSTLNVGSKFHFLLPLTNV